MKRSADFYLLMLGRLLLVIRNLEDSQLDQARSLAYIFHNVPGLLRRNFNENAAEEAYQVIRARAEYFGLSKWIDELEKNILEQLKEEPPL